MASSQTVVAALKFEGGVLISTDSQASDMFVQVRWEVTKARQIAGMPLVVAFSGSTGRAEDAYQALEAQQWRLNMFNKPELVRRSIRTRLTPVYEEIKEKNQTAPPRPLWEISLHGLCVCWAADGPHIFECELNGDDSTHEVFHAVGSGSQTAYAIFRTLGGKQLSALPEPKAVLTMLRILRTTVGVEMWGVSDPFALWRINRDGVKELGSAEIEAHMQYVSEWEEQERRTWIEG